MTQQLSPILQNLRHQMEILYQTKFSDTLTQNVTSVSQLRPNVTVFSF
jgi:hypothetical protein